MEERGGGEKSDLNGENAVEVEEETEERTEVKFKM